jgi:hypothetical protein
LLIHIEVQSAYDKGFAGRMFRYNIGAYLLYDRDVVSLAVLRDDNEDWRPGSFAYGRWGCETRIEFGTAKLLEYLTDIAALEASTNPFAAVTLAHAQAVATRRDPATRRVWKLRIVKGLYGRGWASDDVRELFRLIDWIMELPADLQEAFRTDLHGYEEVMGMQYVTSIERLARDEGRREELLDGIAFELKQKFGQRGRRLLSRIGALKDLDRLRALSRAIRTATTLNEV